MLKQLGESEANAGGECRSISRASGAERLQPAVGTHAASRFRFATAGWTWCTSRREHGRLGAPVTDGLASSCGSSAFGDLVLVSRERSQDLILFALGDLEEVERAPKFRGNFVELGR